MRKIKNYGAALTVMVTMMFLFACSKKTDNKFAVETNFNNTSLIQVFIATVNATRNHLYVDNNQLTGATMGTGSLFPSAAYASSVSPGLRAFLVRDTLSATTQVPLSFAENMQVGKSYTIFLYDTITTPKQKTVPTNIIIPADTSCRIRFANFIYNPVAVPAIDIFSYRKNVNIATNLAVTDVTNFIAYPSGLAAPPGLTTPLTPDTLYIRETGSTVNIIKFPVTLTLKRSYTLVYRGSHRGTRTATLFTNY